MLYLNKLWDDRKKMKHFWWIYLFQNKMKPLWQDSFLNTQADIYACSNYFYQGFFLLIWLHYGSVKAGTRFFPFCFPFFILLLHGFCFMFLFFIFMLLLHVFILSPAHISYFVFVCASCTFSLASLDNVLFHFTW